MKQDYDNKSLDVEKANKQKLKVFHFPTLQKTVKAKNLEEAEKKVKKLLVKKSK